MKNCFCGKFYKCTFKSPDFLSGESNGDILLLVKDEMLLLMHEMMFKHYGYRVKTLSNADDVCKYLKKRHPDLMVFDMEVRENLCRQIAVYLKKAKIPVLLVINSGEECNVCKYLEPELCDYVDSLSDELRLIIKKAERLMGRNSTKQ